jgi:hypothetical protein
MKFTGASILAIAEIVRDSAAMNDAALAGDFDEALSARNSSWRRRMPVDFLTLC